MAHTLLHTDWEQDTAAPRAHHLEQYIRLAPAENEAASALPEMALLAAIVMQAYVDATRSQRGNAARLIQQEAQAFFAKPGPLEWFCDVLNCDPALLRTAVQSALQQQQT